MGKKITGILLYVLITFSVFAGGNSSGTDSITKQAAYKPRILVAYFSRADENYGVGFVKKGNTEIIAEMIAEETGADSFKIERATPYPSDYKKCTEEARLEQSKNARPELKNTLISLDDYDVIFLGMPVWWSDMPMPVYKFAEGLDWNGKTVYPFTTHAGSGLASIPRTLKNICNGATIADSFTISGTDAQNNQSKAKKAVLEWIKLKKNW